MIVPSLSLAAKKLLQKQKTQLGKFKNRTPPLAETVLRKNVWVDGRWQTKRLPYIGAIESCTCTPGGGEKWNVDAATGAFGC